MKYFYEWNEEEKFFLAPEYTSAEGVVIKGERLFVVLYNKKKGSGSRLHTHPNEQFIFILQGNVKARVKDEEKIVKPGGVIYIPADAPHSVIATTEEDVIYYVAKDAGPIGGTPVDGKKTGPHYEPGFEPKK